MKELRSDTRLLVPLLPLIGAFVACVDDRQSSTAIVRDSAGIRIVENTTPLWQEGEGWHLSPEPVVDIGGGDAEENQLFRVTGATRLSDGRIVIANGGSMELKFYAPNGAHIFNAGGTGGGPGEFQSLGWFYRLSGDSLIVHDYRQHRTSVFDTDGASARSFQFQATTEILRPAPAGAFQDGTFLVREGGFAIGARGPIRIERPEEEVFRYDASGAVLHTLGSYPGIEFVIAPSGGVRPSGERVIGRSRRHFGRSTAFFVHGDHFYVGDNVTYEIKVYSLDGELDLLIRKQHAHVAVTPDDIEAVRSETLARMRTNEVRQRVRQALRERPPAPPTMPAFAPEIRIDEVGNLWVRQYNRPKDKVPRWTVFDQDGVLLGSLTFPVAFSPLDIGADYILGVWRDADDVEHVRMYELVKP